MTACTLAFEDGRVPVPGQVGLVQNVVVAGNAKLLCRPGQEAGMPGRVDLVADNAGPRGNRTMFILLLIERFLVVALLAQTTGWIINQQHLPFRSMRIVTLTARPFPYRFMNNITILQLVTIGT